MLPKVSSPSYGAWVCLKQRAAPLGPRVPPAPPHPFFAPRFAQGPVKTGPVGNVADDETDVTGPGAMERWLGVSQAREQQGRVVKDSSWEIFLSSIDKASAPALGTGCHRDHDRADPHRRDFLFWGRRRWTRKQSVQPVKPRHRHM